MLLLFMKSKLLKKSLMIIPPTLGKEVVEVAVVEAVVIIVVAVVNVLVVDVAFGLVFMKGFLIRYLSPNGNEEFVPVVVVVVNFVDVDVGFVFDLVFLEFNCSNISLILIPPISSEEIVVVVVVELVEVVESVGGSGVLGVAG